MKLSDFELEEWSSGKYDDSEKCMLDLGYTVKHKYGCSIGFGLSLIVYSHINNYDRVYELIVYESASLIQFSCAADEWQFLLEYLPKIKQYWDGTS